MSGGDRPVVRVASGGDGPTLAVRVLDAARQAAGGVVLLGDGDVPDRRLVELLTGPYRIGAVVPGPAADQDERTRTGKVAGARDVDPAHAAVAAAAAGAVAVSSALVHRAAVDPSVDDAAALTKALIQAARAEGRRIVSDPSWGAAAFPGADPAGAQHDRDDEEQGIRVLVVTGPLPSERFRGEDRAVAQLIRSLARLVGPSRVTVMCTERVPPPLQRRWTAAGLDVIEGPAGWGSGAHAGADHTLYSHVIMTRAAAQSSVADWLETAQPQAARVVYFPSLDFRDVVRIAPISPPDEMDGLELVRLDTEAASARVARWAHAIWCQWPDDAAVLRSWVPGTPVLEVPPALDPLREPPPPQRRHGILLIAGEAHDVIGGHEDAALRSLEEVVPRVRRRDPAVACTVVADRPSPMLVKKCSETGARLVPEGQVDDAMAEARVLLASHGYGSGQPAVLMSAIEAGLPMVVTPWAAGDLDLGNLAGVAVCGQDDDLATRTWQLLSDDRRWRAVTSEAQSLAVERYPRKRHEEALSDALAQLGVTPTDGPPEWPEVADPAPRTPPFVNPRLPIRPEGTPSPGPLPADVPFEEKPRYRLWHRRNGPTPEVLDAILAELDLVTHRPLISILMPVYNTDADVLLAAVESVRAQIYDRWQLCMANDGSDRPETRQVLDGLRDDPRIVIVDRDAPSGISEATNAALALATGDYVAFLDHDDVLKPHALAQVIRWLDADPAIDVLYTDEDKLDPEGQLYDPNIKPDWAPDQLTAQNYVCHLTVARRSLVEEIGGLRKEFDGSQDYDLILRITERTDRIAHIPEPLYSWRAVPGSAAAVADAKPYAIEAARRAVADALSRRGYGDRVDTTDRIGFFRARYPIPGSPKVSIIIPTRNGRDLLERCLNSVLARSTYRNYEVVIIDNGSVAGPALEYMAAGAWRVIRYPYRFNYARMINLAARSVDCDAMLFLNNDTEVITPDWIEGMLEHAMRPEVGAVGCRLYFGNGMPQHEGIMTGIGGWAHSTNHFGYWARGELTRDVSAVTGACTMMRPSVFWRVGGNDERLRVAYNDVDLCLRLHQAGYQVVYTPYVELYHHESSSRGKFEHPEDGPLYNERWRVEENVDPYYSPMFEDFPPFLIRL
ncbi:MAG TPA: glycosyltransferase [Acidimicrobiales bacterium]|nr:glycosyltransferase [Acidimicrobiales bacterium]